MEENLSKFRFLIGWYLQIPQSDWLRAVLSDIRFGFENSARGYSSTLKSNRLQLLLEGFLLIFKLLSSVSRECRGNFFELQLNDVCARFNSFVFVDSHVVVYVCACPHCFMELRSRPAGKQRRINEDKACLKVRKPLISPNSLKYYAWFGEVWISL